MKIYKVKSGYELVKDGKLYTVENTVRLVGTVSDKWRPSGKLCKDIPPIIRPQVFKLLRFLGAENNSPENKTA